MPDGKKTGNPSSLGLSCKEQSTPEKAHNLQM